MPIYYFVKMGSGWFGRKTPSAFTAAKDVQPHIENGDIVVMADDIEYFCDKMNVVENDITMWK